MFDRWQMSSVITSSGPQMFKAHSAPHCILQYLSLSLISSLIILNPQPQSYHTPYTLYPILYYPILYYPIPYLYTPLSYSILFYPLSPTLFPHLISSHPHLISFSSSSSFSSHLISSHLISSSSSPKVDAIFNFL